MDNSQIIKKTYNKFFIPTTLSTVLLALFSLLNIILASLFFGNEGRFVSGLILPIVIFSSIITYLFGVGGCVAVSVAKGRGENGKANSVFNTSVVLTLISSVVTAVLGFIFLNGILHILGAVTESSKYIASTFVLVNILSLPITLLFSVLVSFIRNDNNPNISMQIVVITLLINFVILLFTVILNDCQLYFIPLATAISNAIGLVLCIIYFLSKKSNLKFSKTINFQEFKEICGPGVAGAVIFLFQAVLTIIINNVLLKTMGSIGVEVYAVIKYFTTMLYSFYDGVNLSAQPMFGAYYGDRDNDSSKNLAKYSYTIIFVISVGFLLITALFARSFANAFEIKELVMPIILLGLSSLFSSGVAYISSYYRFTGKEKQSIAIVVSNNLVLPSFLMLFCLFVLDLGSDSVWWSLLLSEMIVFITVFLLYRKNLLLLSKDVDDSKVYKALILNEEADILSINADIEQFCERNGVSAKKQYYIFLCIEEIAVNIIKHGFKDGNEHYIQIRLVCEDDGVLLNIRDDAKQFDPTIKTDADITASAEDRDIGGLGIYLVKKVSKEFSYSRVIGFNNLHIKL